MIGDMIGSAPAAVETAREKLQEEDDHLWQNDDPLRDELEARKIEDPSLDQEEDVVVLSDSETDDDESCVNECS